jgi:proteasome lid subunit RPN8/RPN11
MVAHAHESRPSECCGVLLGTGVDIIEAVPTRNIAADRNRFLIDPQEHIEARREGRRRGLDTLGFYHSHPASAAVPSATDVAEATYPDHFYGIVSLARDPADVRIYSFEEGAFREVPFVTVP